MNCTTFSFVFFYRKLIPPTGYVSSLATLKIPKLKTVGAFSLSEHDEWSASSARMTDLNQYSGITSIGSVTISWCKKLVDFSGLSQAIPTFSAQKWSVAGCGYIPTYQDMVEGRYTKVVKSRR